MIDSENNSQSHWIPLSDLMTGLMMVFLLISVLFINRVQKTTTLVVQEFENKKSDLALALQKEFEKDLNKWDAEILRDMTVRFGNQDVMFDTGSAKVKPAFQEILKDFIPRYIKIITDKKFVSSIKEIRIEGHTSKFWSQNSDELSAYINNMKLSQARSQAALEFILGLSSIQLNQTWIREHITSNGFSSSKPIYDMNKKIDDKKSQRVEFRIMTNSEEKMKEIFQRISDK